MEKHYKNLVVSVMFLFIALFNMIFHYHLLAQNPLWGFIICIVFVVGAIGTVGTLLIINGDKPKSTNTKPIARAIERLTSMFKDNYTDKVGKASYGIFDNGIFGARIVAGIITGVRLTDDKPIYEITHEKNSWWVTDITDNRAQLLDMLKVAQLDAIQKTAKVKLKYHD